MNKPHVHDSGFWLSGEEGHFSQDQGYFFDAALAGELTLLLQDMSVCDFGCGLGKYVRWLRDRRFDCDGYDGNPNTRELTGGICNTLNFAEPVRLSRDYDAVMSFEVGEHIPKQFEPFFIDNLASHARRLLVMSWAVPGQDGDGHINCRSNSYIIKQLRRRGFRFEPIASQMLRANCSLYWFKQTLMVFSRRQAAYSPSERRALFKIIAGDLDRLKRDNRSNSPLLQATVGKVVRTISNLNENRRKLLNKWRISNYNASSALAEATSSSGSSAASFFPVYLTNATDFSFLRLSLLSLSRSAPHLREVHIFSDPSDPLSGAQMDQLREICEQPLIFELAKYSASNSGPQILLNELYAWAHLLRRMPDNAYLVKINTDALIVSGKIFETVAKCGRAAVTVPFSGRRGEEEPLYFVRARGLRQTRLRVPSSLLKDQGSVPAQARLIASKLAWDDGHQVCAETVADGFSSCGSGDSQAMAASVRRLSEDSSLLSFRDPQSRIVDKAKMQLAAEVILGALPTAHNPYSDLALKQA
jgi:hypothetical protein